jgi:hypothetical protein
MDFKSRSLYPSLHRKSTLPENPVKQKKNQNFAAAMKRFMINSVSAFSV